MNKKHNVNFDYIFLIFIFFIIIVPISLSYKNITNFDFNLIDEYSFLNYISAEEKPKTGYLFTLPISFIFIVVYFFLLILLNFHKVLKFFFFLFFIFISFINFFFNRDLSYFILIAKIVLPIFALLGFDIYFEKIFLLKKNKSIKVIKKLNYTFILIFMIIFFVSIISPFYLDTKFNWLTNKIAIYDFDQYFPLIFIYLLAMLSSKKNWRFSFLLVYVLCFYLYTLSNNNTFFILLILFGFYYILSSFIFCKKKFLIFFTKFFVFLSFIIIFLYPILITIFHSEIINLEYFAYLSSRFNMIYNFYNNTNFLDFLTPIKIADHKPSAYHHNEFTIIIDVIGLFGVFLFYLVFLKRILQIAKYYPEISFAISSIGFLSSIVITPNLHPYTSIITSFFISYYYFLSKLHLQKSLN